VPRGFKSLLPRALRKLFRILIVQCRARLAYRKRRSISRQAAGQLMDSQRGPRSLGFENLLVIVIDCLRRDHLSLHGYGRRTTPFLDEWAANGVVFDDAVSVSSWTYPAVTSILTGMYPHTHGAIFLTDLRNFLSHGRPGAIRGDVISLPELLTAVGFSTYMTSAIAPAEMAMMGRFRRIAFSHYRNAEEVLSDCYAWMKRMKGRSAFAYVHLGDLHEPIVLSERARNAFGRLPSIPNLDRWDYERDVDRRDSAFLRYREGRIRLYDAALLYVDDQIRKLFGKLSRDGFMDRTLAVVTADHGEEFWEHYEIEQSHFFDPRPAYGVGHGHHLWQELLRIPLLMAGPGLRRRTVVERVSHVDLVPTVMDILGFGSRELPFDGISGLSSLPPRALLAEDVAYGFDKRAVLLGQKKLYEAPGDGISWVFDLEQDPGETSPCPEPELAQELQAYLPGVRKHVGRELEVDQETERRLRELGYLE
jgi:arylsulfatase A-like enzyme